MQAGSVLMLCQVAGGAVGIQGSTTGQADSSTASAAGTAFGNAAHTQAGTWQRIPAAMFHLGVGSIAEGHACGAHNPKMVVDESALTRGAALYAYCAARYLAEHQD